MRRCRERLVSSAAACWSTAPRHPGVRLALQEQVLCTAKHSNHGPLTTSTGQVGGAAVVGPGVAGGGVASMCFGACGCTMGRISSCGGGPPCLAGSRVRLSQTCQACSEGYLSPVQNLLVAAASGMPSTDTASIQGRAGIGQPRCTLASMAATTNSQPTQSVWCSRRCQPHWWRSCCEL